MHYVLCVVFAILLAAGAACGGIYVYTQLYPAVYSCAHKESTCDGPLRCCIDESHSCVQTLNENHSVTAPVCKPYDENGCGDRCVLAPTMSSDQNCQFFSNKIPCTYLDTDWRVPGNTWTKVFELSLDKFSGVDFVHPGSTHEITLAPDRTVWLSNKASDVITVMTIEPSAHSFEQAISMASYPIHWEGKAQSGGLGLHAMLFPKHDQIGGEAHDPIMFLVLENVNSIGIYNWKTHELLRLVPIPLSCSRHGEPFHSGTCVGKSFPGEDWTCRTCSGAGGTPTRPEFTSSCPTGAHPHAITEDSAGNLWVALKVGGLARLSFEGGWRSTFHWFVQDLGRGALSFFVAASPSGHAVWANSMTYHEMFLATDVAADVPTVSRIRIDEPFLYRDHELAPVAEDHEHCPTTAIMRNGPQPAGFIVLPSGAAVATLYNSVGALVTLFNPAAHAGCEAHQTALMMEWRKCIQVHHIQVPAAMKSAPGSFRVPAFLHIVADTDHEYDHDVKEFWLSGSSNNVEGAAMLPGYHPALKSASAQPDELYLVDHIHHENTAMSRIKWRRRFRAPTQGAWVHRMALYPTANRDEPIVMATQLLADQVMAIVPAAAYLGYHEPDATRRVLAWANASFTREL